MEKDCIFCKIVNGEIPSYKIYEDNITYAFLDLNPVHPGHTLIAPKKHFINVFDIDEDTVAHISKIAKKIALSLKKMGADGVNITQNNGEDAGQVIFHFHTHIIPRIKGDGLPLWPQKKAEAKELEETAKKIIAGLARQ